MVEFDILEVGLLIVVGDLIYTLARDEGWGMHYRHDPMADYITNICSAHQLKDIRPHTLCLTWYNARKGVE